MLNTLHNYITEHTSLIKSYRLERERDIISNLPFISEEILDMYNKGEFTIEDLIQESLKTYNNDIVISKLNKESFSTPILDIRKCSNHSNKEIIQIKADRRILDDEKFKNLIKFFNYTFTGVDVDEKEYLDFEPNTAECINDYIHKECHNILYHIVKKNRVDSILKSGLKIKGQDITDGGYRNFSPRVFLLALTPKESNIENFRSICKDMFGMYSNYNVLKLDFNKSKFFDFYNDPATSMEGKYYAVYTFSTIPPQLIKKVIEL